MTTQMPVVSVCMATFNGGTHLKKQIETILMQLKSNDELIISDDGSTDSTVQIIQNWADDRIKLYKNESQAGVISNFQNALSKAKGDYIFLADQDDIWLPDRINTISEHLANNDLVLSNCKIVDSTGHVLYDSFFEYRDSRPGFWRNLIKNPYIGCCMAFRRSVLSYVLPIPPDVHMHDWWIGLLVELKGKVYFLPETTMLYIRHGTNASPTGETSTYSTFSRIKNRFCLIKHLTLRLTQKLFWRTS